MINQLISNVITVMAIYFQARLTGLNEKQIYIYISLIPASYMRTFCGFFTPSRLWTENTFKHVTLGWGKKHS